MSSLGWKVGDKITGARDAKSVYIYGLASPVDDRIRYIGMTVDPVQRLKEHRQANDGSKKARWISKLRDQDIEPYLTILEISGKRESRAAELRWIRKTPNLVNGHGFKGHPGVRLPPK